VYSGSDLDWAVDRRISSSYDDNGRNISNNVFGVQRDQSWLSRLVDIGRRHTAGWLVDGRLDLSTGTASQLTHQSFGPRRILLLCSIVVATLTCLDLLEWFGYSEGNTAVSQHTAGSLVQLWPLAGFVPAYVLLYLSTKLNSSWNFAYGHCELGGWWQ